MAGNDGRPVSESASDNGNSTNRMADETRDTAQHFPTTVEEPREENPPASRRVPENGDADQGTNSYDAPAAGLDEDKGKGKAISGPESPSNGRKLSINELSKQLSNGQKPSVTHSTYISPNGIPRSELGLPYTVVSAIARRQLEANDLPPSRRAMFEQNTDPNQGPGYISPIQLYDIRDGINGQGRGMFATGNIKKGQLIMFEHPLITLYFCKSIVKWSKEIIDALDNKADTSGSVPHEASSNSKGDGVARPLQPMTSKAADHQPTSPEPTTVKDTSKNPRNFIEKVAKVTKVAKVAKVAKATKAAKVAKAFASKSDRHHDHHYENDESVEVTEAPQDDADDVKDSQSGTRAPSIPHGEDVEYKEEDDTQTLVRKRLVADFSNLCKFSPAEAVALRRLQDDPERQYGSAWLLRLWQRFSREVPGPGTMNPELLDLDQKVMTDVQLTPAHCRSLYKDICYINHSCFPNARLDYRYEAGACYGWLFAASDIIRNDEITLFYEKDDRFRRKGTSDMTVESGFGFDCGCQPCLGGYKDRESWEART